MNEFSSHPISRRQILKRATTVAMAAPVIAARAAETPPPFPVPPPPPTQGPFKLEPLGYAFNALEPHFDARTMEIHYSRHHQTYVTNLNKAVMNHPELGKKPVEDLLKNLDQLPESIRTAVRNNGGGHYNHTLFWKCLKKDSDQTEPEGDLQEAFGALFSSKEEAKEMFTKAALGLFGSGWLWISLNKDNTLKMEALPNQDNPLMFGRTPLFGLDLWEHAYYLKYMNKRADYVEAFSQLINWGFIQERWKKIQN